MKTRRKRVILGYLRRVVFPIYGDEVSICNFSCTKI
nr:MAG TPA: hypothetical protein [Caudoviricetes sp.]